MENAKRPLSHASLIKAYVEGIYPYGDCKSPQTESKEEKPKTKKKKKSKKEDNNLQLELFKD